METVESSPESGEDFDFKENTRELVLSKLMEAIEFLHRRGMKGQIKRTDIDRIRIQYLKALVQACSVYNQISQNLELDELKEDLENVKKELKKEGVLHGKKGGY